MPAPPFPTLELLAGLVAALIVMLVLWWRQLTTRDATAVDIGWTLSIGGLAITYAAIGAGNPTARWLAAATAGLWSLRLGTHLLTDRVLRATGEDPRYAALRARLGPHSAVGFLAVYLVQGVLAATFALPFLLLAQHPGEGIAPIQWCGLATAGGGLALETAADRVLAAHRRRPDNRGRTCRRGPWRYSRHPNYFGEWLLWCGFAAVATPAPHGAIAWLVPAVLFVLVRWVSGVPFAEQQARRSRGDDYRHYTATTNAFFPWWPRASRGPA